MEIMLSVQNAEATLSSRGGRSPTVVEIAEYLGIDTEQVLEGMEAVAARRATSLDEPIVSDSRDESALIHDTIGSDDEGYEQVDTSVTLAAVVKQLRAEDRRVLALRINDELTQKEIAARIGVSQTQVSRILRRITDELHERIEL
jgi:RNA polymerase sigma-B factor